MSNLNIMRTSCCKFLGDCKAGVSSLVADRLHTVLRTGNIFLDDCFFLKRLSDCCFNRRRKICRICHLGNCSAARAVCRLYDHRKALRLCYLAFSHTFKIRHRNSCLLECTAHSIFIRGLSDAIRTVSRKSEFFCQILHRNICKIRTNCCYCIRFYPAAFFQDLIHFHNAYLIKKIRILCPCCTFSPGKNMCLISHFFCFQNQRLLKIICPNDHDFFHNNPF